MEEVCTRRGWEILSNILARYQLLIMRELVKGAALTYQAKVEGAYNFCVATFMKKLVAWHNKFESGL